MPATDKEVVFITGANTGIGFQLAKVLLRDHGERFYVIVGSRNASKGETAVRELHDQGLNGCETIPFEVTSDDSISNAATTIEQKFGKLDVLHVNVCILMKIFAAKLRPDGSMTGRHSTRNRHIPRRSQLPLLQTLQYMPRHQCSRSGANGANIRACAFESREPETDLHVQWFGEFDDKPWSVLAIADKDGHQVVLLDGQFNC